MNDLQNVSHTQLIKRSNTHFIRHFLALKKSNSTHTALAYERDILDFFHVTEVEQIQLHHIIQVTLADAESYLLELHACQASSATINRKISSLSSLYNWLLKYQDNQTGKTLIHFNPFARLKEEKPRVVNKETAFLTPEECRLVLDAFDTTTILGLRNKAILALAFTTALRKSEIINIRLEHLKNVGGYDIIEVKRKGGKTDTVKVQPVVKELIDQYVAATERSFLEHAHHYLFIGHSTNGKNKEKLDPSTLNYMIKTHSKKVGLGKDLTVHSTRHTAITLAITGGATIEKVRDFAAHSSLTTTNRYIHSIDRLKDNATDVIDLGI